MNLYIVINVLLGLTLVFTWLILFYKTGLLRRFIPQKLYVAILPLYKRIIGGVNATESRIPLIMTDEEERQISDAIRLTFTGDLILLKDMVENAYDEKAKRYSFDSMFQYVKEYYAAADLNIGVLEGPVAGEEKGFSLTNVYDDNPRILNFPVEFLEAIKRAGINVVTQANNHLLDKGVDGMCRTIDELDRFGISHVGAYKTTVDNNNVKIIQVENLSIALISYTYGLNYLSTDFFYNKENRHLTKCIVPPKSKYIRKCIKDIEKDFEAAKEQNPDLIIVLPHMGTEFSHIPDNFQRYWMDMFVKLGADVIFSCHSHVVQPIEWRESEDGKNVLVVYSPGSLVNSYTEHDGDANMLVECYISKKTGKPFAASCIPLYSYCKHGWDKAETYCAIPIYKLLKDKNICPSLSEYEYRRICKTYHIVTKVALGYKYDLSKQIERFYTLPKKKCYR